MKIAQVAAQMYSVRDYTKTPAELAKSLAKIKKIGYQAVQLSGHGPISDSDLRRVVDDSGLTVCATHEPGNVLLSSPKSVVEKLEIIGCRYTAYPYPGNVSLTSAREVKSFAAKLAKTGTVLAKAGIHFSYHNHDIEFVRIGGKTILEMLIEEVDPKSMGVELDVYWAQAGGGNPADWCKRLAKRMPLLHIKDYGVTTERKAVFKEIGQGNLDWPTIIRAAERSGCKWFIVEQDANFEKNDPFLSLKMSFDYIKKHLVAA